MRSASFGKTWVTGDVTPWLHALASRPAGLSAGVYRLWITAWDRAGNRSQSCARYRVR
ncbi:MAG: hypothetical protein K0S82_1446 [Gaiellaceae bacterium]|jgi:hypothetical protein|nr:hypothetical protein [Gaiellaceae bacterium]